MIRVGTPHRSYQQERTIFVDHGGAVAVRREIDPFAFLYSARYRATHRVHWSHEVHTTRPLSRVDVFHLYNAFSVSRRPWVVTAENSAPYAKKGPFNGEAFLARDHCKRILALSEWALSLFRNDLADSAYGEAILGKAEVLRPPQRLIPRNADEDASREGVRMLFVGTDFFRKGGLEILRAFDRVASRHSGLELEIISSLAMNVGPPWKVTTAAEVEEAHRLIERHPQRITWSRYLPNSECLRRMGSASVGLLPTFNDNYGFSALELMAAGCPVIATNQRALAEIVTDGRGWVVEMPLSGGGTIRPRNDADAAELSRSMVDQLSVIFGSISENPDRIAERRAAALEYVRGFHDPSDYAARLRDVYREALTT